MSTDEILELPIEQNARPRIRPTAHRNWFAKYERALRSIDVAMIVIAVGTAYLVKFGDDLRVSVGASPLTYAVTASIIGVVWWLVLGAFGSRQRRVIGHGLEEYIRVVSASHFTFGGIAIISYIFDAQFSRAFFLVLLPLGTFSVSYTHLTLPTSDLV